MFRPACFLAGCLLFPVLAWGQLAQISSNTTQGCAPLVVGFQSVGSQGAPPLVYHWDFGNGNTASGANQANPGAVYALPGTYTATLRVQDATGAFSAPVTATIQVFDAPVADFSVDVASGCPPLAVSFSDLTVPASAPITSWIWDFGDGNASFSQQPTHAYATGTFGATLIVTDANGCQGVAVKPQLVQVSPAPSVQAVLNGPSATCQPQLTAGFSAQVTGSPGPFTFQWNFGDGSVSSLASPTHTFTQAGNYAVSVTVTDQGTGCASVDTVDPVLRLIGQVVDFSFTSPGGCVPVTVGFSSLTPYLTGTETLIWYFGNGDSLAGAANSPAMLQPTYTYTQPGVYQPVLVVDYGPGLCRRVINSPQTVAVSGGTTPQVSFSDTAACQAPLSVQFSGAGGQIASWFWDFGDGQTSNQPNPSHAFLSPGIFDLTVRVTDSSGCETQLFFPGKIRIQPPVAAFTTNLDDLITYPQYWDGRNDSVIRGGCLPLGIQFSDASFSVTPVVSYSWDFGDGNTLNALNANPLHTYLTQGVYSPALTITTADGCVSSVTCSRCIRAGNSPTAMLDTSAYPLLTCCSPSTVFINTTDTARHDYVWYAVTTGDWHGQVVNDTTSGDWAFGTTVPVFVDSGQYVSTMFYAYNFGCADSFFLENWVMLRPPYGSVGIPVFPCESNWPPGGTLFFDSTLVNYIPNTGYIDSVLWQFGDPANSTSNLLYPTFTYPDTGLYWITLTVWNFDNGCSCTTSGEQLLQIVVQPDTTFMVSPASGCAPLAVSLTGPVQNAASWNWDIGPGLVQAGGQQAMVVVDTPGVYGVQLIVATAAGCADTVFQDSAIRVGGLQIDISADTLAGCAPWTGQFSATVVSQEPVVQFYWTLNGVVLPDTSRTLTQLFPQALYPPLAQDTPFPLLATATDSTGCVRSDTLWLRTYSPLANWQPDTLGGCLGDTLVFSAMAGDSVGRENLSYEWTLNAVSDTGRVVQSFFPSGGPYAVELTVTDESGCSATRSDAVTVAPWLPLARATADPREATCPPLLVNFTDLSLRGRAPITRWEWTFSDGSKSALPNPVKIFSAIGTYSVTLSVQDALGCRDTVSLPDLVRVSGVVGSFSVSDETVCASDSLIFTATSPNAGRYTWDFGDGNLGFGPLFTHTYTAPGLIFPALIMEDSLGRCALTLFDTVEVFPRPGIPMPPDTSFCEGGFAQLRVVQSGVSYLWSTGDTTQSIRVSRGGTYGLVLTDRITGCTADSVVTVVVFPGPSVEIGSDTTVCEGVPVNWQAMSNDTLVQYLWYQGPALRAAGPRLQVVAEASGPIRLITSDLRGCPATDSVWVEVVPDPRISLDHPKVCTGDTVLLSGGSPLGDLPGATYLWLQNGFPLTEEGNQLAVTVPGEYRLMLNWQGCQTEDSTGVEFYPVPESNRYERLLNCVYMGQPVLLDAGPAAGYLWEHNGVATRQTGVVAEGVYYFQVFNAFGCATRDSFEIVDVCPPKLFVPNTFTPNGDAHNEEFRWGGEYLDEFRLMVFSRWGIKMFETTNPNASWDGRYLEEQVPEGVYTWVVYFNGVHPAYRQIQQLAGTVTLIR
jgi:gliding motility-associated-like protein